MSITGRSSPEALFYGGEVSAEQKSVKLREFSFMEICIRCVVSRPWGRRVNLVLQSVIVIWWAANSYYSEQILILYTLSKISYTLSRFLYTLSNFLSTLSKIYFNLVLFLELYRLKKNIQNFFCQVKNYGPSTVDVLTVSLAWPHQVDIIIMITLSVTIVILWGYPIVKQAHSLWC